MLGTSGALSEVYLDGALVGSSTAANTAGRTIERIRYGLVAQGGSSQTKALTLYFDRARVGTSAIGPSARRRHPCPPEPEPRAPSPSTAPSPTPAPTNAAPSGDRITSPVAGARFGRSLLLERPPRPTTLDVERRVPHRRRLVATDSPRPYAVSVNTRKLSRRRPHGHARPHTTPRA